MNCLSQLDDLLVNLAGAKLKFENVLMRSTAYHTSIEHSTVLGHYFFDTTFLELGCLLEILADNFIADEVADSALQHLLGPWNFDHFVDQKGSLDSL